MPRELARDSSLPSEGRKRVLIVAVEPSVDHGRHPAKRTVGERVTFAADLVADGHDVVAGVIALRGPGDSAWIELPLLAVGNDRFEVVHTVDRVGRWEMRVEGWVDALATWSHGVRRKLEVDAIEPIDLAIGAALARSAVARAGSSASERLHRAVAVLADPARPQAERTSVLPMLDELAARHPDRTLATVSDVHALVVDPVHATFAAWYELFPRSTGKPGEHGNLRSAEAWLPYVREMGFDVVYLPPVHPIGRTHRKGRDNSRVAAPGDPGSPWAIGAAEGGHLAIHPELGTIADFERFVGHARASELQVALDIAFQAAPDHPWVREHPQWFRHRPDRTIQYAENPPKKYEDVYPFDFETEDWRALWLALRDVFFFWIDRGVTIFRVDNPHTKPIAFWDWCIATIKARNPEVTFLAEAFTRPTLKYALAKHGFSQGYTYFTWRSTKVELERYLTELTQTEVVEYFRPSLWPNTPDILSDELQIGGRPAFVARLVLAATLSSHYGIYGPAYELMEHVARPGSGEYLANEKYEVKAWDLERADSLRRVIAVINRIRREHVALHDNRTLRFHATDNEMLICYSKSHGDDAVLVVVNLDHHHRQAGWIALDAKALALPPSPDDRPFQVHDLLGGGRYLWHGARNYVEIDPLTMPAQIFAIRRKVRTERDFDYWL